MIWIALYLLVGVVAGIAAGLLGIGGGVVNVPALNWIFSAQGMPPNIAFHLAVGTSLATIIITSTSAFLTHYRNGNVYVSFGLKLAAAGVFSAILGAYLGSRLHADYLKPAFGAALILASIQLFLDLRPRRPGQMRFDWWVAASAGFSAGFLSGIFGIGGGIVAVPIMLWIGRFEPKRAVATSSLMVIFMGLSGAATYLATGWQTTREFAWSFGYLHLLALIFVAFSSIFTARLGAQIANRINPLWLKRAFAVLLVLVGLRFLAVF